MSTLIDDFLANPIVGSIGTAIAVAGVALWLAAAWWAWQDASRRTESTIVACIAAAWIILSTPLLLPLSLAVYAVARPSVTAAEHRAQSLVAALSADGAADSTCPTCAVRIEQGWVRCPQCATWLAAPCASCGAWSPAGLELCPFCGREGHAPAVVEDVAAAAAFEGLDRTRRVTGMAAVAARHGSA